VDSILEPNMEVKWCGQHIRGTCLGAQFRTLLCLNSFSLFVSEKVLLRKNHWNENPNWHSIELFSMNSFSS
jgi:hypothetical protein